MGDPTTDVTFRPGRRDDVGWMRETTLAGVRHWGHDRRFPAAVAGLASFLEQHDTADSIITVVEDAGGERIAFYELVHRDGYIELLRMFQRVDLIGTGLGRRMWDHCVGEAANHADRMYIEADPGAVGFYEAMGAEQEGSLEPIDGFVLGQYWYDLTT